MEHLLHYVWKHKLFPLKVLQTTNGLPVEVIDPGLQNPNAGPDFFNAKLKIDGALWVGNIEIHTHSSDWFRHGHHSDKTYDSVILHVVSEADTEITRSNGEQIPQLLLTCPENVQLHYHERLEQKAQLITQRLKHCNSNWEDAFFITLARNFGFGLNGDAFETWAGLLPFRAMDKHRNDLFQIEAFFYGLAGLLEETFLKKEQEDEYSLRLCKEFRYLQRKFEIGQGMDATLWRFLRLRPENFPHIRLAQLAYLYQKGDKLFSRLLEAETLADVRNLLDARTSPYWENHYLFGRLSSQKEKAMGERSKDLIIINTVVPFLYTYGLHKADERMCERAGRFLEELKAESNHIIRSWSDAGLAVVSAADSQALIQLQKEYCDKRKCLYCRFGYEYLKHT